MEAPEYPKIGGRDGEGWKTYFHTFKNIQFACS